MRYLKEQHIEDTLSTCIMTLSRMVDISDATKYFNVVKVFSECFSFDIILQAITLSAHSWNSDSKLSFDKFVALVRILMTNGIKPILKVNEDALNILPLA